MKFLEINLLKKRSFNITIFILVTYITAVISIQIIGPDSLIIPNEFPEECPKDSLNCTMIGPQPHRGEGKTELRFNSNLSEVILEAKTWINDQPRTEILGEWDNQIHAVFRTMILRFPDDFVINLHCENGTSVMHIYSKSRMGISDLGVKNERVSLFTKHMENADLNSSICF